jgi:hypothetical protein
MKPTKDSVLQPLLSQLRITVEVTSSGFENDLDTDEQQGIRGLRQWPLRKRLDSEWRRAPELRRFARGAPYQVPCSILFLSRPSLRDWHTQLRKLFTHDL